VYNYVYIIQMVWESAVSFPSGVRSRAPVANDFSIFWRRKTTLVMAHEKLFSKACCDSLQIFILNVVNYSNSCVFSTDRDPSPLSTICGFSMVN